jgi:CheY-like chemotaxis protein
MDNSEPVILYVEDDSFSRQVMEFLLVRGMNFQSVTIFDTSEDFMNKLVALPEQPELIFLDIHMQPFDGFQLLAMLRAHADYQSARIVALTASVMNDEVDQLRQAGFDGVLAKPIDQSTFPDSIQRILNGERIWNVT